MSDTVITGIVTTIGLIVIAYINAKQTRLMNQVKKNTDEVKKNTDGLVTAALVSKDKESQAKQELSKEIGKAEATAEAKIEIDKLNKDSNL